MRDDNNKLSVNRLFTRVSGEPLTTTDDVYNTVEWVRRTASIRGSSGKLIFEQKDVEVPAGWSQLALNVVASKYFYGKVGTPTRERSVRVLITRVVDAIATWSEAACLFKTSEDSLNFKLELTYILLHQIASFNSPVWFNVGIGSRYGYTSPTTGAYTWNGKQTVQCRDLYANPQCSACFIQSVDDTIEDIMRLATSEAVLFKSGSGSGTDLSTLRSTYELLSGGGTPSGPVSFMQIYDTVAGVIKSGGKTRRAAKMQSLGVWHPDIIKFINAKPEEEKKAKALINAGYDGSIDGAAYGSSKFQNANLSVRVTDTFMNYVVQKYRWEPFGVTDNQVKWSVDADSIWDNIADAAWHCGDPGLQYHDTINKWHTCKQSGTINASNPCSEYMFLDDTACNLASINLLKMLVDNEFNTQRFTQATYIMLVAQELMVDNASYPTKKICENSHLFRPLGLGYANLGALLMTLGMPYDSDEGRATAAAITSLLTASAYITSNKLALALGSFEMYTKNKVSFNDVIARHYMYAKQVAVKDSISKFAEPILDAGIKLWGDLTGCVDNGGFRNAQVTVLAPTGTIGFMMDCDTTGIEPDIALVKHKALSGGGGFKLVNQSVGNSLRNLSYTDNEIVSIIDHITNTNTIEGCDILKEEHLPVFDCAFKPANGIRSIAYMGHINMMAAVQPFISGAISKTVNMPATATREDIADVYMQGWKLGLKAVAIYRENSKGIQPISVGDNTDKKTPGKSGTSEELVANMLTVALDNPKDYPIITKTMMDINVALIQQVQAEQREKLPTTRSSITHKFTVQGHEGYMTIGMYDDGRPGELFITMSKEGSTVRGLMDGIGVAVSLCFQYGVPLSVLAAKYEHTRFEPAGFTGNQDVPIAKSLLDYVFRWLSISFPGGKYIGYTQPVREVLVTAYSGDNVAALGYENVTSEGDQVNTVPATVPNSELFLNQADAPTCPNCGSITVRNGNCYLCHGCGTSLGCS